MSKRIRLSARDRKRVILKAAIDVFSESNYRSATISEISKRAGITDPMIYKFFDSKKELFIEVLILTNIQSRKKYGIKNFIEKDTFTSLEKLKLAIERSLNANFQSMNKHYKEVKVFYQAISEIDDPDILVVIQDIYQKFANLFIPTFEKAKREGLFSENTDVENIAWELVGFTIQQNILFLIGLYSENSLQVQLNKKLNNIF